jgi:hypothetical protein
MANDERDMFLVRSQKNLKLIYESIDNCKNISTLMKKNVVDGVGELEAIIREQSVLIKCLKSSSNAEFGAFSKQQQNVNKEIFQKLEEIQQQLSAPKYSTIVKRNLESNAFTEKVEMKSENVLIVRPVAENVKSNETEKILKSVLINSKKNIAINNIKFISKGGLAVNCGSTEDREELAETISNTINECSVTKPKQKNPKIVLYGVDSELTENDITNEIVKKNKTIKDFLETTKSERIEDHIKCKFQFRKKNSSQTEAENANQTVVEHKLRTWVLEVSPKIWQILSKLSSVYVGFRACRFEEYLFISRCFNCNGFGHKASECKQTVSSCGKCGQNHDTKNCKSTNATHFCSNCDRFNKTSKGVKKVDTNHTVFSQKCESLIRIKSIIRSRTQYV